MRSFRGKKALVTGAASGIGRAIVMALAKEGANLWLLDIDEAGLASTAREAESHGVNVATSVCDLADPEQITAVVDSVLSRWGNLNILVNSAGITHYGPMHLTTGEQWQRILSVDLLAPIQLVRALFATLAAQDDAHILNVCSMFGLFPFRKLSAYQTSKFGLIGFTLALRGEYHRPDFGITALCPGFVHTAMIGNIERSEENKSPPVPPAWLCTSADKVAARACRHAEKQGPGADHAGCKNRMVADASLPDFVRLAQSRGLAGAEKSHGQRQSEHQACRGKYMHRPDPARRCDTT